MCGHFAVLGPDESHLGWPEFNGEYINCPRFRKDANHGQAGDELVPKTLEEKCMNMAVKIMVENVEPS
jgi:hypothetical protein